MSDESAGQSKAGDEDYLPMSKEFTSETHECHSNSSHASNLSNSEEKLNHEKILPAYLHIATVPKHANEPVEPDPSKKKQFAESKNDNIENVHQFSESEKDLKFSSEVCLESNDVKIMNRSKEDESVHSHKDSWFANKAFESRSTDDKYNSPSVDHSDPNSDKPPPVIKKPTCFDKNDILRTNDREMSRDIMADTNAIPINAFHEVELNYSQGLMCSENLLPVKFSSGDNCLESNNVKIMNRSKEDEFVHSHEESWFTNEPFELRLTDDKYNSPSVGHSDTNFDKSPPVKKKSTSFDKNILRTNNREISRDITADTNAIPINAFHEIELNNPQELLCSEILLPAVDAATVPKKVNAFFYLINTFSRKWFNE